MKLMKITTITLMMKKVRKKINVSYTIPYFTPDRPRRYSYEPEVSPDDVKRIIKAAMDKKGVTKEEIPKERPFTTPEESTRGSKRYFETKGFAWFSCPKKNNRWPSAHAWCCIDLKEQKICYRDPQDCRKCESKVDPEFTEESIKRMAEYAVKRYLIKTGNLEQVFNPSINTEGETEGGPHDEKRCGKCKRLGRSCWK